MRKIYLEYLTQTKDAKRLAYDDLAVTTNISKSKLQRVFTGQVEPTVSDLEIIVEKGLKASMSELYALVGEQEMKASEKLDFKGARALMEDFNAEKAQIRQEYEMRIEQSIQARIETQEAFSAGLKQLEERYTANATYLTGLVGKLEASNADLSARAVKATDLALAAQKRAEASEKRADELDRRRYQVFWGMLGLVILLVVLLALGVVLDLPLIGMGNG